VSGRWHGDGIMFHGRKGRRSRKMMRIHACRTKSLVPGSKLSNADIGRNIKSISALEGSQKKGLLILYQ
jgi:hypothetical protein